MVRPFATTALLAAGIMLAAGQGGALSPSGGDGQLADDSDGTDLWRTAF